MIRPALPRRCAGRGSQIALGAVEDGHPRQVAPSLEREAAAQRQAGVVVGEHEAEESGEPQRRRVRERVLHEARRHPGPFVGIHVDADFGRGRVGGAPSGTPRSSSQPVG